MGYHLRDEAAAGPRAEARETGRVLTGFESVGSGYRYYSSELGRWINRDPIGERGGHNLYGMLVNRMKDRIDILGTRSMQECHGFLQSALNERTLPMWLDLSTRGCIGNVFCGCCGGATGTYNLVTKDICIRYTQSREDLGNALTHELQHAYDLCDISCFESCAQCLYAEARAQKSEGRPLFCGLLAWSSCANAVSCDDSKPLCTREENWDDLVNVTRGYGSIDPGTLLHNIEWPPVAAPEGARK